VPCKYTFTGEKPHLLNLARLVKRFSMRKRELNNEARKRHMYNQVKNQRIF